MSIIVFLIGFLTQDGTLGAQLINGFYYLFNFTIVISVFIAVVLIIYSIGIFNVSGNIPSKEKGLVSLIVGGTSIFVGLVVAVNLFLLHYIYTNINVEATSLSEIGGSAQVGIIIYIVLFIVNKITNRDK